MQCPRTWRLLVTGLCLGLSACLSPAQSPASHEDASGPDLGARFVKNPDGSGLDLSLTGSDASGDLDDAGPADADADASATQDSDIGEDAEVTDSAESTDSADVSADATETGETVQEVTDTASDATQTALCGDGTCANTESCGACPSDCGTCPCGVLGSTYCAIGQQCFPNGDITFCAKAGSLVHGAPCKFYNECEVGTLCAAGLCRQLCDFTSKNTSFSCKPGVPCEKLLVGKADPDGTIGVCKPGAN